MVVGHGVMIGEDMGAGKCRAALLQQRMGFCSWAVGSRLPVCKTACFVTKDVLKYTNMGRDEEDRRGREGRKGQVGEGKEKHACPCLPAASMFFSCVGQRQGVCT